MHQISWRCSPLTQTSGVSVLVLMGGTVLIFAAHITTTGVARGCPGEEVLQVLVLMMSVKSLNEEAVQVRARRSSCR